MSCPSTSSKQTRNIRLEVAKRMERPLDYTSPQSSTGKAPVKRKRLVKACDACHKSKRRCDGMDPCDNCYYASKECIYTDSSGRPVPAPNAPRLEPHNTAINAPAFGTTEPSPSRSVLQHTDTPLMTGAGAPDASAFIPVHTFDLSPHHAAGDSSHSGGLSHANFPSRKHMSELESRSRLVTNGIQLQGLSKELAGLNNTKSDSSYYRAHEGATTPIVYHKHIIRELVNLFFAHCHPHRLIIHSTSFYSDLCRNRVPLYLLNAICAVAAPLSHNPLVREEPVRQSGEKFAAAALKELLDADNKLLIGGLEAAQALVLIQAYEVYRVGNMDGYMPYFDLSLWILHSENLLSPSRDGAAETNGQLPSEETCLRIVRRECARRTFWLVHMIELLGATFTRRPMMYKKEDLEGVRLPCDEASFDLALEAEPEYLDAPALKTSDASEFGHIIRVANLLLEVEANSITTMDSQSISHCEDQIEQWSLTLPDHLKYTPRNLQMQLSLWETGSNTSTWCFCFMHIMYSCAILALSDMRRAIGLYPCRGHQDALAAVPAIMNGIGPRARNSILLGSVLWLQYCGPHAAYTNKAQKGGEEDSVGSSSSFSEINGNAEASAINELLPQLDLWIKEWEEFWGPATMHNGGERSQALVGKQDNLILPAGSNPSSGFGSSTLMARAPAPTVEVGANLQVSSNSNSSVAVGMSPSSVHSDPEGLNQDSMHQVISDQGGASLRGQPSLPSLKASGLLEVTADDTQHNRSSVTSTSAKQPLSWALGSSASQHAPFLSAAVVPSPNSNNSAGISASSNNTDSSSNNNNSSININHNNSNHSVSSMVARSPAVSDFHHHHQQHGHLHPAQNGVTSGGGFQALRVPAIRQQIPQVHVPEHYQQCHQQHQHRLRSGTLSRGIVAFPPTGYQDVTEHPTSLFVSRNGSGMM